VELKSEGQSFRLKIRLGCVSSGEVGAAMAAERAEAKAKSDMNCIVGKVVQVFGEIEVLFI
jgi:hypothetical protein